MQKEDMAVCGRGRGRYQVGLDPAGIDAERLMDAKIRVGKGLSGWVARNRRILVNVNPRVEFEAAGVDPESRLHSAIVCTL